MFSYINVMIITNEIIFILQKLIRLQRQPDAFKRKLKNWQSFINVCLSVSFLQILTDTLPFIKKREFMFSILFSVLKRIMYLKDLKSPTANNLQFWIEKKTISINEPRFLTLSKNINKA